VLRREYGKKEKLSNELEGGWLRHSAAEALPSTREERRNREGRNASTVVSSERTAAPSKESVKTVKLSRLVLITSHLPHSTLPRELHGGRSASVL
jgi:hypothetical protein